jgi:hypothetical protein
VKNKTHQQSSRRQRTVLRQVVELIPAYLVARLARRHGVDRQARSFSAWSHIVALVYAQLSHALSLNDVCDALRLWVTPLRALRGATPPSRNALSHANRERNCALGEQLFWEVLKELQAAWPGFGQGRTHGLAWRFRRTIHIVDTTVIELVVSCLDWARHRRRKAAAKCHLRLSLRSLLPGFVVVTSAKEADVGRARQLCAGLQRGEVVLFDRGYLWLEYWRELTQRGVFFVTRAREDMRWRVIRQRPCKAKAGILADELVEAEGRFAREGYPEPLRRVTARVKLDGEERILVFLTNNLEWTAGSVAELYRCRWQIEAFFKQIKQTLQLADFLGNNANAVQWQIWTALLVYVLLRFQAWRSRWTHSFTRLFTLVRAALWLRRDVGLLLRRCGTADGHFALLHTPAQSWLPGFAL